MNTNSDNQKKALAVLGIGTDIAEVSRISSMIERYGSSFLEKTFTQAEIKYCDARASRSMSYAARFAAKEAMAKALGTGIRSDITLKSLSVENDELGAPHAILDEHAQKRLLEIGASKMLITLTHTKEYAQAIAMAVK